MSVESEDIVDLIARRVRRLRQTRGLSQEDVAVAAGIRPATLSGVENARGAHVSVRVVKQIADVLGCSVGELVDASPPTPSSEEATVVEQWRRLDEDERGALKLLLARLSKA